MTVYTVHEPPPRRSRSAGDASNFVFVRDGFHFWAFVLGPIWMLARRLWLTLLLYIVIMALVQTGLWALGVSGAVKAAVALLIGLLVGIEASTLRRWTYARRKWIYHGVVSASDIEKAERRFFDGYPPKAESLAAADASTPIATMRVPPASTQASTQASTHVIGLFPEPESRPRS